MKKSRYSEEQIAYALKHAETGTPVAEVLRRMGLSEQTFYRWKKLYAGLGVGELQARDDHVAGTRQHARPHEIEASWSAGRGVPNEPRKRRYHCLHEHDGADAGCPAPAAAPRNRRSRRGAGERLGQLGRSTA